MYYINYVGTYKVLRFLSNKVSGFSFNDPGRIYKKYENLIISRNVIIFVWKAIQHAMIKCHKISLFKYYKFVSNRETKIIFLLFLQK